MSPTVGMYVYDEGLVSEWIINFARRSSLLNNNIAFRVELYLPNKIE